MPKSIMPWDLKKFIADEMKDWVRKQLKSQINENDNLEVRQIDTAEGLEAYIIVRNNDSQGHMAGIRSFKIKVSEVQ